MAVHVGKTWARALHVTPLGLTPKEGGSYDYSCLVPSALKDDPTKGGLLCATPTPAPLRLRALIVGSWARRWSHNSVRGECARNPAPKDCWLALFSRFPLDF